MRAGPASGGALLDPLSCGSGWAAAQLRAAAQVMSEESDVDVLVLIEDATREEELSVTDLAADLV